MSKTDLEPRAGVSLSGKGIVVEHRKVLDQVGRWHGLIVLVLDGSGLEYVAAWMQMLPDGADVSLVRMDHLRAHRMHVYYKIEEKANGAK